MCACGFRGRRSALLGVLMLGFSGLGPSASAAEAPKTIEFTQTVRERCLRVLREGLGSDEFWPSMHAAEALTVAGHGDEVLAALKGRLDSETDDQKRCGLAREQARAGDRTKVAVMLDILAKRDDYGHVHAAESLYKVFGIGDGRLLRKAMAQRDNVKLRLMAAGALARCGSAGALKTIRDELASDDPDARYIAAWLLARIGDRSDIPALQRNFERETVRLNRAYAAYAMACHGSAQGLRELKRDLSSGDPALRTYAAVFAGDARALDAAKGLLALLDDPTLDVRIRAAQSLLVLSRPAPEETGMFYRDVYPATEGHPRYSEGSIIVLADGRLLYATTEFSGAPGDHAGARIVARESEDGGRTWGKPRVLQKNVGKLNVMSVTLRRLAAPQRERTPIGMFHLVKNSLDDLQVQLRISRDDARTFGAPILVTDAPGYHVMNNDRVTRLSSGRLLCPVSSTSDVGKENHFRARCWLSDDGGETWRAGKDVVDLGKRGAMEPEVIELDDERVLMILRTQFGYLAAARSSDGGDTWSEPSSWNITAPEAPATLRRIPATGDLLLVWNNAYSSGAGHGGKRTPLTAALSSDEGRTWRNIRDLESDPTHTYAYTSLIFDRDRALLSYYVRDEKTGRISSRFRSAPITWFTAPASLLQRQDK